MSHPSQYSPPPQQSGGGGASTLMIVLVILGVLFVVCGGLCAGCVYFVGQSATVVQKGLQEGLKFVQLAPAYSEAQEAVSTNQQVIDRLGEHDIAVPVEGQFHHPLAAVYRTRIVPVIAELLAADQLRPAFLFDRVATCRVPVSELAAVDPGLETLQNLNRPEDYLAALAQVGLAADPQVVAALEQSDSDR